ncbi:indole-3-glycerol phosphate synthase TrpC [Polyangium mundeleinium]|uniref:indole-3-glycerol-phosphate synthase n=1 Tax=Polyangium mundeleinium TaxID=2995306 RepID=A0ABT5F0G1_9BACT|nr:indole-3-glycerol-phosphate synthase TrpC [Polyangium mundeleinium]MDC0747104.1 indole-3-glycerol-phosphate synthase TrpC [Polyangium mundeleinium]
MRDGQGGKRVLDTILASKRAEIAALLPAPPPRVLRAPAGGVFEALRRPEGGALRLLAEVKLRSPSAGALSSVLRPAERARRYAEAGATMISVLVDGPFFGGSYDDLAACRDALDAAFGAARPKLLCKEFILDPIQLAMAAAHGADAALLIARITSAEDLARLADAARALGIEPFVEVATEEELAAAERARARVLGINARDLDTLVMDHARAERVLGRVDRSAARVHLSGLASPSDVARIAQGPADAALVGEALMRQDDPGPLLAAMVARAAAG